VRDVSPDSQRPSSEPALLALERRLDRRYWRSAERLATRWRQWRRDRSPAALAPAPTELRAAAGAHELTEALARALAGGALESARELAERLEAAGTTALSASAQALLVETLLMLGERARARSLAETYADGLSKTVNGTSMRELVGLPGGPRMLPDQRPNMLGLSRQIANGMLDAETLAQQLNDELSISVWLRAPELHLLCFSALLAQQPQRAVGFLNRFLSLHGAANCRWSEPTPLGAQVLERLRFEPQPPRSRGPLVSVLVAAHNSSDTVGYAIDSLLAQSHQALEILICDDASEDASLDLLKRRYAAESRVRLFRSRTNQGAYNVRNALAQRARGELLTFHDADDLALPDRIARQVACLERSDAVGCVGSWVRITPAGQIVFFKNQKATRLCLVSMMLKRSTFEEIGPFRSARVGADWELYSSVIARFGAGSVRRLVAPVMLGLWSSSSVTRGAGTEALEDGYRAPPRRLYSELVSRRVADVPALSSLEIDQRLRDSGNLVARSEIVEAR
jgi:hypothetical protein